MTHHDQLSMPTGTSMVHCALKEFSYSLIKRKVHSLLPRPLGKTSYGTPLNGTRVIY